MHGERSSFLLAVALTGVLLVPGCVDGGQESTSPAAVGNQTEVDEAHALNATLESTVSLVAGVGHQDVVWLYYGAPTATVDLSGNVSSFKVYANVTDSGVNATGPGAGFVGFRLFHSGQLQQTKGTPGQTAYVFDLGDALSGDWRIQMTPLGPDVNREATLTWVAHGTGNLSLEAGG